MDVDFSLVAAYTWDVSRKIQINRERLRSAISGCEQRQDEKETAKMNLPVLRLLWKEPVQAANTIARQSGCKRSHVFNVVKWVNSNCLSKLWRDGKFRKERLSTAAQKPSNRLRSERLKLTAKEVEELRQRQSAERDRMFIPRMKFTRGKRNEITRGGQNPVVRIEAVILVGTTTKTIANILDELECTHRDVLRWQRLYRDKGIDGLCECNPGGRPPKKESDALSQEEALAPEEEVGPPFSSNAGQWQGLTSRSMVESVLEQHLRRARIQQPEEINRCHVFLFGVRGSGKTTLVKNMFAQEAAYYDCEDPRVRRDLQSPLQILSPLKQSIFIFDEVGQLDDPRKVLDAALSLPGCKAVLSVSSVSSIAKRDDGILYVHKCKILPIQLLPLVWDDRQQLVTQLGSRTPNEDALVRSGLPGLFLGHDNSMNDYHAWAKLVFERDLQPDCNCDAPQFIRLLMFIMEHSGEVVDLTAIAADCGIEHKAVQACLKSLKSAGVIESIPLLGSNSGDRCKLFASDSGFVHQARIPMVGNEGLQLHFDLLWKHLVLTQLRFSLRTSAKIYSWVSLQGDCSVDFVVETQPGEWAAINCDWWGDDDLRNLKAFRKVHPRGANLRVLPQIADVHCLDSKLEYTICLPIHVARFLPNKLVNPSAAYRSQLALLQSKDAPHTNAQVQHGKWISGVSSGDGSHAMQGQTDAPIITHHEEMPYQKSFVYKGQNMQVFHIVRMGHFVLANAAVPDALEMVKAAWQSGLLDTAFEVRINSDAVIGEEVFTKSEESTGKSKSSGKLVAVFGCPIEDSLPDSNPVK